MSGLAQNDPAPKSGGIFYGWIIVFAAFIAFGMVYGTITYSFGVFVNPVAESMGVTPTQVLFAFTLTNIGTGVLGVYAGRLLTRFSLRYCLTVGMIVLALGFFLLSVSTSLWQFTAIYAVIVAAGAAIVAPLGASAVVTNWFTASRGRALTMATLGTSFGQLLLPRLAAYFIDGWSWRAGYQAIAALLILVAVPIMYFLVVDHPRNRNLSPYGGKGADVTPAPQPADAALLSTREILAQKEFWAIAISLVLTLTVYLALIATMVPYARTFGVSASQASNLVVCMGLFAIIGKFGFAALTDRIGLRNTFWVAIGLNAVGLIVLLVVPDYYVLFIASACIGGSAGGLLPVWPGLVAYSFGRHALTQVMGLMSPVIVIIQGFGAPFATALNYKPAFVIFLVLLLISAFMSRKLARPGAEWK